VHRKIFEGELKKTLSAYFCFKMVIIVVFLNIFYLKIYLNNIFFIFKKLFLTPARKNNMKTLKNINFK
jgi:hypothetical protein